MSKDKQHDEIVAGDILDGDGPGGDSDVEVMAAPQLDDPDAVKISGPGEGAGEPDAEDSKPAEGHEAEAAMIDDDVDPKPPTVTTAVPPVIVENRDSDDLEDSPQAKAARAGKDERAAQEAEDAAEAAKHSGPKSAMNQASKSDKDAAADENDGA